MTDPWRLDPMVARVVAWHNRHPLARRITPRQVFAPGFVALPFAVPDAAAPAAAMAPETRPAGAATAAVAAFSENFIANLPAPRVARWAARFSRQAEASAVLRPLRQVLVDTNRVPPGHHVIARHAMTAAVECGGVRTRVLVGPDPQAPVLGRRLPSLPRTAAAAGGALAVALLVSLAVAMVSVPAVVTHTPTAKAPAARLAADATHALAAPPNLDLRAAEPAADTQPRPEVPPDVEPRLGRVQLPPPARALAMPIDDAARRAARSAALGLRADVQPPPAASAAPVTTAPPATLPPQALWAVTTRLLRTRAESLQWLQAVDELLRKPGQQGTGMGTGMGGLQVEMLPQGDDWRVVGWPFTHRAEAERAQAMLLARGLKVEVVEF